MSNPYNESSSPFQSVSDLIKTLLIILFSDEDSHYFPPTNQTHNFYHEAVASSILKPLKLSNK